MRRIKGEEEKAGLRYSTRLDVGACLLIMREEELQGMKALHLKNTNH